MVQGMMDENGLRELEDDVHRHENRIWIIIIIIIIIIIFIIKRLFEEIGEMFKIRKNYINNVIREKLMFGLRLHKMQTAELVWPHAKNE